MRIDINEIHVIQVRGRLEIPRIAVNPIRVVGTTGIPKKQDAIREKGTHVPSLCQEEVSMQGDIHT